MAGPAPCTELERLARERDVLVGWLLRQFPRTLTIEDAEDIVAEALPSLAADPQLPAGGRARRTYLHRALRRDAIDELRRRRGRSVHTGPRSHVPLELAEALADPDLEPDRELERQADAEQRRETIERTLPQLPADDATVLRLRYLDQRAPDEVARELGLSRWQYERRLKRAGRRGFAALAALRPEPTCTPVRELLEHESATALDREAAARIDVHLTDCLHCRAFALRVRGLLEALPAIGLIERCANRLGGLLGRTGDGALRAGGEAAVAGGAAGAGTALSVGVGTKLALSCATVAVAAVCAAPLTHELRSEPTTRSERAKTAQPKPRERSKVRARSSPTPQATATVILAATATATATQVPTSTPARAARSRRSSRQERRRRDRQAAVREFGPEAANPDVSASSPRARAASVSTASQSAAAPPPPPPPAATAAPKAPASSSFSEEFRP